MSDSYHVVGEPYSYSRIGGSVIEVLHFISLFITLSTMIYFEHRYSTVQHIPVFRLSLEHE